MIMENWKIEAEKAKERKALSKKYPELGKKCRRKGRSKWEEGIIVLEDAINNTGKELFIKYNDSSREQLCGLPYQIWENNKWTI